MNEVAAVSGVFGHTLPPPRVGPAGPPAAQRSPDTIRPAIPETATDRATPSDPTVSAMLSAMYDPRRPEADRTPRGVEIDRIAMIEAGFAHIRDILQSTDASQNETGGTPLDLRL